MKKCVISFASADRNYRSGLDTIRQGLLETRFDGDFLGFTTYPPGCPSHQQAPYAFKAFITELALAAGYSHVLYLDSSAVILRCLQPIFEIIEAQGYFLHRNDDRIGAQCKEDVLQSFDIDRTTLMRSFSHLGGIMGIRADSDQARRFLDAFKRMALDGRSLTLAGSDFDRYWLAKRTDSRQLGHRQQAVTSLIALQLGMQAFCEDLVSDINILSRPIDWKLVPDKAIIWFDRVAVGRIVVPGQSPGPLSRSRPKSLLHKVKLALAALTHS